MTCLLLPLRFDLLFLRRFWRVMQVVHPRLCCKSLLVLFLLIFTRAAGNASLQ
jgi:hypothetical protein